MTKSFWWGSNKMIGRGINLLRSEKLTMRKEHSGMRICHFYGFNLVMLGNKGGVKWKIIYEYWCLVSTMAS
jgi:hypothetical protein